MIRLLVAGDFCLSGRMKNSSSYEISSSLSSIKPYVNSADYSLLNLECSVFDNTYEPIKKIGPNLHNTSESLKALKDIGFNGVTLANNHFADYGHDAVVESVSLLRKYNIDYYGGGENIEEASKVKFINIYSKKIAIINCCEHEYTIASTKKGGSNPLDIIEISKLIQKIKSECNYIILIVHGGAEHYQLPTPRMQKWYRFFIDVGADVVINHHQHCFSGFEYYKSKPIVYGLGNFCFDSDNYRQSQWNKGYMLQLDLDNDIRIDQIPYIQCDDKIGTHVLYNDSSFREELETLCSIIKDESEIINRYERYMDTLMREYMYLFEVKNNRILRRLFNKGLIPDKFAKELISQPLYKDNNKLLTLLSYFQCETHNDAMKSLLNKLYKEI